MKTLLHLVAPALLMAAASAGAQETPDASRARAADNRELPKALYIVPWQRPQVGEIDPHPPGSVLGESLKPIDLEGYLRRLRYEQQAGAAGPAQPSGKTPAGSH